VVWLKARVFIALILLAFTIISILPSTGSSDKPLDVDVRKLLDRSTPPYSQGELSGRFIAFPGGTPSSDVRALVERSGGRVVGELKLLGGLIIEGPPGVAEMLRLRGYNVYRDRILYLVEPLRLPFEAISPMLGNGTPAIGAPRLVSMGYNGSGVRVAVIDTGVENGHPWLVRDGRSVVEWEVDATGTGVVDYCGKGIGFYWGGLHGTHVAGIIASQHQRAPGVAPGVSIYDVIVFPEMIGSLFTGCSGTLASYVLAGIELALLGPDLEPDTGDEADVLSLSLGYTAPPEIQYAIKAGIIKDPVIDALRRAVSKGKVVVIAAGNAYGLNMINALCLADGVICVGASSHMGTVDPSDDMLAWFSSKGPGPLGTLLPHVVAPGVYIYSSIPTDLANQLYLPEPGYMLSGTSMSTPFVSGSAALLISYFRAKGVPVEPKVVVARLVQTAVDVKPQGVEAFWLLPDWYKEYLRPYIPVPPVNTPIDQGGGLINVSKAALAELELSVEGSPVGYLILKKQPYRFNVTVKVLVSEKLALDVSKALIEFWDAYTFKNVSDKIKVVNVISGPITNVTINVSNLDPGVYAGYIGFRVVETGNLYRIPVLLVVPVNVDVEGFRFLEQFELVTGTRDIWDIVTLYVNVEKPVSEPLAITTLSGPGAPGMVSVTFTTPSGRYSSFTNTMGYILSEPGLYTLSAWILYAFEWPTNLEFTLTLGIPTLTEKVRGAVEGIQLLASRVTLLEASLNATIKALEMLRLELQGESQLLRGRIATLNQSIAELDRALKGLGEQLSITRGDLQRLSTTLSNVNTTLSQKIAEEARRLGDQINTLDSRLQQARGDLEALRGELNAKAQELASRIGELEGAHSTTRIVAVLATLIGLTAAALGAYGLLRGRVT
jgi:subtilisin family serine protease/predicted  nucleic acid-binding Zn-ribbon protein